MKGIITSIFLISFIICISSCKKLPRQYYYLTPNAKDYVAFQKGSYWIFQNDSTLIQDSIYVDFLINGFDNFEADGQVYRSEEHISCNTRSNTDSSFKGLMQLQARDESTALGSYVYRFFNVKNPWWINIESIESSGVGITADVNSGTTTLVNTYGQINLNSKIYSTVSEFNTRSLIQDTTGQTVTSINVFVAKGIGVIKWAIQYQDSSSRTFSLLRSKIIF
jgi:hypothetical protein